jgi:hypothetical protein
MPDSAEVHIKHVNLRATGESGGLSQEAAAYNSLTEDNPYQFPGHERPFDLLVDFYETEKCPFTCKNCVQTLSAEVQFDMQPVIKALHNALEEKNRRVILWCNGGEPATVAHKLLRFMDDNIWVGMPTTGLFQPDNLMKFVCYDRCVRMNISVLGSPENEGRLRGKAPKGKLDYKRAWLFNVPPEHQHKISLLYIIFSETLETGEYLGDIEWILNTYPQYQMFISYDRGDTKLNPAKLVESYNAIHMLRQSVGYKVGDKLTFKVGNSRILHPTTFVNGAHFTINYRDTETFIKWEEVQENPLSFFNEVIRHHNMGTRDAMKNCGVWKHYDCGGPGCRFGHTTSCEDYWSQMIPFQQQVQENPYV